MNTAHRTGKYFYCKVCGNQFYRGPSQCVSNPKTCSKECLSKYFRGSGNPFYGKSHPVSTREAISSARKGKCISNSNAKGFKHTEEAKKRISIASKILWENHRDKMLANLPRGESHIYHKLPEERRYRKEFTPRQRREWKQSSCSYCGITEDLVLDHIIPIFDGGTGERSNCQTLCRACNLWKVYHVDLPRRNASLGIQRD